MSIARPDSGTVITKADIQAMHQAVRAPVNAVLESQFDRGALGPHVLPSLLFDGDAIDITDTTLIDAYMTDESEADVLANWKLVTGFLLNNATAGYVLPPCIIVVWATLRVEDFYDPLLLTEVKPEQRQQCWVALTRTIDGVESCDLTDLGMVHGQRETTTDIYVECEEVITIWTVINQSLAGASFSLDSLQVRAAIGDGGPVAGTSAFYKIKGGALGFFAVPTNS